MVASVPSAISTTLTDVTGAAEMKQTTTAGGDVLAVAGTEAEAVAEVIVAAAEALR